MVIETLKKIRKDDELMISGYIRINSLIDIPYAIIQICIAFLLYIDEWDSKYKGKYLKISGI